MADDKHDAGRLTSGSSLLRQLSTPLLAAMLATALIGLYRVDQLSKHTKIASQQNQITLIHQPRLTDVQINTLITRNAAQANHDSLFTSVLKILRETDVLKLNIYNLSGTNLYSSLLGEIGQNSRHPDLLNTALGGTTASREEFHDTVPVASGLKADFDSTA